MIIFIPVSVIDVSAIDCYECVSNKTGDVCSDEGFNSNDALVQSVSCESNKCTVSCSKMLLNFVSSHLMTLLELLAHGCQ